MRRENNEKELPNVPFAENLVFYAPLTQGDLTDHISGVSPVQQSDTSISWDSSKGMYLLESNPGRRDYYVSPLYYDIDVPITDIGNITMCIDVINVYMGNQYCPHICIPSWSDCGKSYTSAWTREILYNSTVGVLYRYVVLANFNYDNNQGYIYFYKNGQYSHSRNCNEWTGSNKKPLYNRNTVAITMANDTDSFKIYAKNARIYNRRMTASEIAQL